MRIEVKVKTNSKFNKIEPISESSYLIQVVDSPEDNKANNRIINLLASYFNLPKSSFIIKSGQKSKFKIIEVLD